MKGIDVAVVGATGAVGRTMLAILAQRAFPVGRVYALASARSAGSSLDFAGGRITVQNLADFDFSQVQLGLFSAGGSISEEYAPKAAAAGVIVVDNTSAFRYDAKVPLVIPEVNADILDEGVPGGIIANPNCSTIQMLVALKPLHDAATITRINVATYQAVSGTGAAAIDELKQQAADYMQGRVLKAEVYPRPIAFNVLPHIDSFQDNGYTREEMKMVWETRKILRAPDMMVNPTAVRVPVVYGHSEAVHIETERKLSREQALQALQAAPGVVVLDRQEDAGYPTALTEAAGQDPVFVGRVREDISHPRGLNIWVVADNVRKGAALNSIQIAEYLLHKGLLKGS